MKKILIIKIGAIGDIIMASPVLPYLKSKYPNCQISWVCGKTVAPILSSFNEIDILIPIDDKKLFSKNIFAIAKSLMPSYQHTMFRKFDVIINYHIDIRYKILELFTWGSKRYRFSRNTTRPIPLPGRCRSAEHIRLLEGLDGTSSFRLIFPDLNLKSDVNKALVDQFNTNTIVLAPGGAKNVLREQSLRRWPIESYKEIARYFISQSKKVIIVGGSTDTWVIPFFENINVKLMIGSLTLVDLIEAFRRSETVITHDSGPLHLAIFAKRPNVIGLFGPTSPDEFTYGQYYSDKIKYLWNKEDLMCCPCYFGKFFSKNCINNTCMQNITITSILDVYSQFK